MVYSHEVIWILLDPQICENLIDMTVHMRVAHFSTDSLKRMVGVKLNVLFFSSPPRRFTSHLSPPDSFICSEMPAQTKMGNCSCAGMYELSGVGVMC